MTTMRRRLVGSGGALIVTSVLVSSFAVGASAAPSHGSGNPYGGFTTTAAATPLRVELYEPAIPLPADPQVELNFSYTNVTGASGPDSTALASAMWPGGPVGQGLPTILAGAGLPAQLAANNYPVQVSSQYPGTPNSGSQEFLPGMTGRVAGSSTEASARSGYSTSGQVAGDPASGGASSPLTGLQSGSLSGLAGALNGPNSTSNTGSNPLGLLSAVVSVGGMSSSSVTDYGDPVTVTSTGTSQLGEVDLLGGIVKLEGVTVSSSSSSTLDGGGQATQTITYGGMTINGTPFKITADGIQAAGSTTAIPGMPSDPNQALASLGISLTVPKPTQTTNGTEVDAGAQGPTITIDTQPIISKLQLNQLPLTTLINQFPDSANQLKTLLLGVLQAHPKIVLLLGNVSSSAHTIAPLNLGGGLALPSSPTLDSTPTTADTGATTGDAPLDTGVLPATTAPIKKTSAAPGLPDLGGVPGLLMLAGLILAVGAAWLFRTMAEGALGAAGTCAHGLTKGLPDLRKA